MKRVAKFPKKLRQVAANAPATDAEGRARRRLQHVLRVDIRPPVLALGAGRGPAAGRGRHRRVPVPARAAVGQAGGRLPVWRAARGAPGPSLVRGALAGVTWAATGRALWLFPNLMDDDKGFKEAFLPRFPGAGAGARPRAPPRRCTRAPPRCWPWRESPGRCCTLVPTRPSPPRGPGRRTTRCWSR